MHTRSTLLDKLAAPRASRWLLAVVLLVTLAAGLDPKGYRFRNEVDWIGAGPGLSFGTFGRAHTGPVITSADAAILNRGGFTIEVALTLTSKKGGGFRTLATVHDGDDQSQLVLGQWREYLIVMNGDDYSHRRGLPRITANASKFEDRKVLLTMATGDRGTRIYLNGEESATNPALHLSIPSGPRMARLTIGNSVRANTPWNADVLGFAVYPRTLDAQAVARHHTEWLERGDVSFAKVDDPFALYALDDAGGDVARDRSARRMHLEIPARFVALDRRAFAPVSLETGAGGSLASDMAVNLFGFIPFGVVLAAVLGSSGRARWKVLLLTTAAGFLLSFTIELIQAWLPSRDSSQLDVLLNTAGAFLGAAVVVFGTRADNRRSARQAGS